MLKAKVEADPGTVLYSLGDAIALYPQCISDLIEAAITAAKPDADTLEQIIRLAVTEYPSEAGAIAEAAMLAAPDEVDVIRQAFMPEKKAIVATPVDPDKRSPIENFLNNLEPETASPTIAEAEVPQQIEVPDGSFEVMTSKPHNPDDVAATAMQAIDEMLAKLKHKELEGCSDADKARITKPSSREVEKFRLNIPDETIAITTINDPAHHDQKDEQLEKPATEPLIIKDPASDPDLTDLFEPKSSEKDQAALEVQQSDDENLAFTSSVYQIPLTGIAESHDSQPAIRSASVSPTMPRVRR